MLMLMLTLTLVVFVGSGGKVFYVGGSALAFEIVTSLFLT